MTNIIIITSFLTVMIVVTYYSYRRSKAVDTSSSEGFFLGGRNMGAISIAATIIMANLSTEQLVGLNGQSYVVGMEVMAWEVTTGIAILALALIFLPKYLKYGINTVPDFLELRFDRTLKRIISALLIFNYAVAFLPTVFYSGALVFNNLFNVDELLGIKPMVSVIFLVILIGVISIAYLLLGGVSLSIYSNSWFGTGLLLFGLSIPFLGLAAVGNGSVFVGIDLLVENTPELLNAIGPIDSEYVPWPTLFAGMLFNNLFYWCTNQMIVQKAFTAKNLKSAQIGVILVGIFKLFGALILVLPGVIARNYFGDTLMFNPDNAYPALVAEVLPQVFNGLFAAVMFGAILSTVIGGLISISTLFSYDIYKGILKQEAEDKEIAKVGKIAVIVMGIIAVSIAPLITYAPTGLYNVIQEFNGLYSMPLLVIVLSAFYLKKSTSFAAKVTLIFHVVSYSILNWWLLTDINFLYIFSITFILDFVIMIVVSKFKPEGTFEITEFKTKVDVKPWKHVKLACGILIILVIAVYLLFSPVGII